MAARAPTDFTTGQLDAPLWNNRPILASYWDAIFDDQEMMLSEELLLLSDIWRPTKANNAGTIRMRAYALMGKDVCEEAGVTADKLPLKWTALVYAPTGANATVTLYTSDGTDNTSTITVSGSDAWVWSPYNTDTVYASTNDEEDLIDLRLAGDTGDYVWCAGVGIFIPKR